MPRGAKIIGVGRALPQKVLTNSELEKMVDTSDAWITERTGIKERRILEEGLGTSDLATQAAKRACQQAGVPATDVDAVIVATVTPDMPLPATAVFVQHKLGLPPCPAFDIAAACAGFVYGLSIADAMIKSGAYRRVLVIGAETLSRITDWSDRNTCVLFGDGAGAVLLAPGDGAEGLLDVRVFADGEQAQHLTIRAGGSLYPPTHATVGERLHTVRMNGRQVFTHAVRRMSSSMLEILADHGLGPEQVDLVLAHQANARIIEGIAEKTHIPLGRFFTNIERYGNTSSASIPIAMSEALEQGELHTGDLVLLTALGAGFAWGSALMKW